MKIKMYATKVCPYCNMAVKLLEKKGISSNDIEKILIDIDSQKKQEMIDITNRKTVPQIFINDVYIGGYDDLQVLENTGKLDPILNKGNV